MLDKEKLIHKIQYIEDNLSKLEKIKSFSREDFLNDFIKIEAAKHLLQISVESMIDIAAHIIARKRLTAPGSSAEMFDILKDADILKEDHLSNYKLMARFRNRIVHLYNDIDDTEIFSIIQDKLHDFREFISEIVQLI